MIPRIACSIAVSVVCLGTNLSADAVDLAASLIGRPYVWGAEGPHAFDCSGLTQFVYREFGVELPRRAINQSRAGDAAGRRLQRGDLLFFSNDTRRSVVTHVGIYEGDGMMIDASQRHGRVRRDELDDPFWTDRFMFARRLDGSGDIREARRSEPSARPTDRSSDRRRTATRVLEQVADILIRRRR